MLFAHAGPAPALSAAQAVVAGRPEAGSVPVSSAAVHDVPALGRPEALAARQPAAAAEAPAAAARPRNSTRAAAPA